MRWITRRRLAVAAAAALLIAACNVRVLAGGSPAQGRVTGIADCALVLGARVYDGERASPVLEDRLETALALYRGGTVQRILVSGDHGTAAYDEVNMMRAWLEARGVPPRDLFLDHAGFDTYSSVRRARDVFLARRIIVVTQRFHMPRALYIARALGLEADGARADRRRYRGAAYLEVREVGARVRALLDVTRDRSPHHGGAPIPITGDGLATRD